METLSGRSNSIEVRPLPGGRGLALSGELDMSTIASVRPPLEHAARPGADVRLDLAALEFMDSSGLNLLLAVLHRLGPTGRLTLSRPTGIVVRLLRISGVDARPNVVIEE